MMKKIIFLLLVWGLSSLSALAQQTWDWHIAGGTIVDGTGAKGYSADVLIRADSIGFIGKVDADTITAAQTVDASGKLVTPGFIDVHAHGNPTQTPGFQNFLAMGVTTILLGQDGSSPTSGPLAQWFNEVEDVGPAVNVAALVGHGTIRQKAGVGKRPANEQELDKMERFLAQDLKSGAFGISTGLEYVPGLYADEAELISMAEIIGQYDGIIMSHMRSEDDSRIEQSLQELAKQGKKARVHASHLKVVYGNGAERAGDILREIQKYREQGIIFSADTYPYTASYTGIGILFPAWAKTEAEWHQAMDERPGVLRSLLQQKLTQRNGADAVLFGSGKYAGKTLRQAADKEEGMVPVDLLLKMGPNAASAAHFVMNEALQDSIATAPGIMISSDGSPTMYHPRGYGSFAKVIHRYVQEQQSLSIEQAVYKMSGLPAQTIGLTDRGELQTGKKADILVFNPDEVADKATFSQPHQLARGFNWVWVNGKLVCRDGSFTDRRPGNILKKK